MFEKERQNASFNKKELSLVIYDSQQQLDRFLQRQKIAENDPVLRFDPVNIHRSREDIFNIYAKKLVRYTEIMPKYNAEQKSYQKSLLLPEQTPLSLHELMFLPTLRNLCDEEQVQTFLNPAEAGEIIGCYAQTQLGHGSDVKSLMTTATYDEKSQSFIMNTPNSKAAKWWIGDLGVFCTHACVFAQLITKEKKHGVHAFVVPIRDKQHRLLPGVEAGDVGPKFGFNGKDNGYLVMPNVKIPRKNMLMKYHRVSKQGQYSIVGDQKITYATMLKTRAFIPRGVFYSYSKTAAIMTRYSLARKQFKDNKGNQIPILNYQLQQEKMLPRIAEVYANVFALKTIGDIGNKVIAEAKEGNFTNLNESHVLTSAVKAVTTKDALTGMETIRRAGGGHGFSSFAGVSMLLTEVAASYTFEGDFTILMLQVARYLLKSYNRLQRGSPKPLGDSVTYMRHLNDSEIYTLDTDDHEKLRNPENIIKAYISNSCQRIKKAGQKLLQGVTSGMDMKKTWDELAGLELVEASTAHSYLWMVDNFYRDVLKVKDQNTRKALERLLLLYAIEKIIESSASFFETKSMTTTAFKALRQVREKLFAEIRPDALTLVQAFEYTDHTMMSAIGTSDGKPYEKLLEWARHHNDVNAPQIREQFRKIGQDLLKYHRELARPKL